MDSLLFRKIILINNVPAVSLSQNGQVKKKGGRFLYSDTTEYHKRQNAFLRNPTSGSSIFMVRLLDIEYIWLPFTSWWV